MAQFIVTMPSKSVERLCMMAQFIITISKPNVLNHSGLHYISQVTQKYSNNNNLEGRLHTSPQFIAFVHTHVTTLKTVVMFTL
jgi:hypothetical protein